MAAKWKTISKEKMLLREFNRQTETVQSDLQKIQDAMSKGYVPGKEVITAFHESLQALRDKYNEISTMAKDKLPDTELPPEGSTAQEYITALNSYKEVVLAKLREKALADLDRFTHVLSEESSYCSLLRNYQQDARENITTLKDPEKVRRQFTEIEDYEKVLAPAETFLKALDCEDLDSEKGVRLLDKVCEYYSLTIAGGIMHGKYYVH